MRILWQDDEDTGDEIPRHLLFDFCLTSHKSLCVLNQHLLFKIIRTHIYIYIHIAIFFFFSFKRTSNCSINFGTEGQKSKRLKVAAFICRAAIIVRPAVCILVRSVGSLIFTPWTTIGVSSFAIRKASAFLLLCIGPGEQALLPNTNLEVWHTIASGATGSWGWSVNTDTNASHGSNDFLNRNSNVKSNWIPNGPGDFLQYRATSRIQSTVLFTSSLLPLRPPLSLLSYLD